MRRSGFNTTGDAAGNDVGFPVISGTQLEKILEKVNNNYKETDTNFNAAISHKKITVAQFKKWSDLFLEWDDFYKKRADQSFISPWEANAAADLAESYDLRRAALQEWLKSLAPTEVIGPDPPLAVPPPGPPEGPPWGLISGAITLVVVAYLASPLIRGIGARATEKSK